MLDGNGVEITVTTHIGYLNPIRYRGYYYDTETGLYYLKTRYYDPEVGRFISPDSIDYLDPDSINGLNLYAYCGNNPVVNIDLDGRSWESFWGSVKDWFLRFIGFNIAYENTEIKDYWFWFEYATGMGMNAGDNKPINIFINVPKKPWKLWEYSIGIEINYKGKRTQIFIGTEVGFAYSNEYGGVSVSFDGSGRLKFAFANNISDTNFYKIDSYNINTHNIFGTIMVAIFAPYLIPNIIGAAQMALGG